MFDSNKNYTVAVWDVTYFVVDENDNPIKNEDGSVKEFYTNEDVYDYCHLSEGITVDDLKEISLEQRKWK
jgi:hypothetical protein